MFPSLNTISRRSHITFHSQKLDLMLTTRQESTLHMVIRLRGGGEFYLTFIYMGELFQVDQHCPSISALKGYIFSALGIPMRDQIITLGGKAVEDGRSILNIASTLTE